jgi:hypothetical protein
MSRMGDGTRSRRGIGLPCRLLGRDLPAGILSTKDALDDGNAYDSAKEASCRLTHTAIGSASSRLRMMSV